MSNNLFERQRIKSFHKIQRPSDNAYEFEYLNDRMDCLQRSVANLRKDIPMLYLEMLLKATNRSDFKKSIRSFHQGLNENELLLAEKFVDLVFILSLANKNQRSVKND
jgi:hypothetical protein